MRFIKVKIHKSSYDIIVGDNILAKLGSCLKKINAGTDAYIITNSVLKKLHGRKLTRSLKKSGFRVKFKLVPDSEKSKSIKEASAVLRDIAEFDKEKRLFIIAFGGGVVGDLAGFVASVYRRGIPYVQVPTTLLAQVDSSIGGKTAVDLAEGKNLVGAFYQPRLVFTDIDILKTLSPRQIKSGMSEVIKYAIISSPELFLYLEKNCKNILEGSKRELEHVIFACCSIKAKIVASDEREKKGIRTILNFGHTIGHAIEAAAGYKKYNHGEAVALGMLTAVEISREMGLLDEKTLKRIEKLTGAVGLPGQIKNVPVADIIKAHYHDKKFIGYKNRFVLLEKMGRTKVMLNVPLDLIKKAVRKRSR